MNCVLVFLHCDLGMTKKFTCWQNSHRAVTIISCEAAQKQKLFIPYAIQVDVVEAGQQSDEESEKTITGGVNHE